MKIFKSDVAWILFSCFIFVIFSLGTALTEEAPKRNTNPKVGPVRITTGLYKYCDGINMIYVGNNGPALVGANYNIVPNSPECVG